MTLNYTIDLATGKAIQVGPMPVVCATTADEYFCDPAALATPAAANALADIYQWLLAHPRAARRQPADPDLAESVQP